MCEQANPVDLVFSSYLKSSKKEFRFDKQTIREDRLKKKLGVIGFRLPPVNDDNDKYSEK